MIVSFNGGLPLDLLLMPGEEWRESRRLVTPTFSSKSLRLVRTKLVKGREREGEGEIEREKEREGERESEGEREREKKGRERGQIVRSTLN